MAQFVTFEYYFRIFRTFQCYFRFFPSAGTPSKYRCLYFQFRTLTATTFHDHGQIVVVRIGTL